MQLHQASPDIPTPLQGGAYVCIHVLGKQHQQVLVLDEKNVAQKYLCSQWFFFLSAIRHYYLIFVNKIKSESLAWGIPS